MAKQHEIRHRAHSPRSGGAPTSIDVDRGDAVRITGELWPKRDGESMDWRIRSRPKASQTVSIWNPADCYTMTDGHGLGGQPRQNPKRTAALGAGPLPVGMLDCISGT